MACGSCGGGRRTPTPRSQGLAQQPDDDPRPHLWRVDFPNGTYMDRDHWWQANAARAVGGGFTPYKVYTDGKDS